MRIPIAETAYAIGSYHELAANWIRNGPESGFMPYPTYTGGITEGWGTAGIGLGLRLGWSLGEPTMGSFYGFGSTMAGGISLTPTSPFSISGDFSMSYNTELVNWISTSIGIGLSVPGIGEYTAETWIIPLEKK